VAPPLKAFALPEAEGVVGEAAGAAVGPVGGVLIERLARFEDGVEEIVILGAGGVALDENVAERVALRASTGVARRVETRLHHDLWGRPPGLAALLRMFRHVFAAGAVAALAVGAEIEPRSAVLVLLGIEVLLLLADMAGEAALIPDLHFDFAALVGIADVEVVEPLFAKDVPTRRQDNDAPAGSRVR
jgi:hypothetical protein